ncbi:MAG: hypothetical protein K2N64_05265 [Anaeroplasmataceae bacterium]|nr:hypothetical protein [Anaeroplasmataceae bacterium]
MSTPFIRYYLLKDSLRFIHSNITYMQDTSNSALFKYALFYDAEDFYKVIHPLKKDIYKISSKIKDNFFSFLKECLNNAYLHASAMEQLFCYYIFISHLVNLNIESYIEAFSSKKDYAEKMIDTYFFNKNEKLKLHKTNIADYFFSSFQLSDEDIALLEKPIKRQFGFFCTKNYYLECYQSARFYFDHLANSQTGIKKLFYIFYDLILNHRKGKKKAKTFLYPKRIDTTILNLTKQDYTLLDTEVNFSLEELYQHLLKESRKACDLLNSYFTGNQNLKPLEKYFKVNEK